MHMESTFLNTELHRVTFYAIGKHTEVINKSMKEHE